MKTWNIPTVGNNVSTPSGTSNLNDLADVAIASPVAGQIIKYDGSTFINSEVPGLTDIQAQFNNLNASNLTSGIIPYPRLPNLSEITLSGGSVPPYISSITFITPTGNQTIEIIGEYFSPITQLSIPGVTVNSLDVRSPGKIVANISKSGLSGNKIITLSNGSNSNQLWAEGIKSIDVLSDPYYSNVVLFLKGDGENNSINIIDSSLNPKSITRFGDTKISTNQSKYGGSSIYFDGNGDFLALPNDNAFLLNSDFTIETWFFTSSNNEKSIFSYDTASGLYVSNTTFTWWQDGIGSMLPAHTLNISNNQWHHAAVCRKNNLLSLFFNGNFICAGNLSYTVNLAGKFIGRREYSPNFVGYMNSFRISQGIARYSANFNPETDTYLNT